MMSGIQSTVRDSLAHGKTGSQQCQFSQKIQGADLADPGHAQQQSETRAQFCVLVNEGLSCIAHLLDPVLQIAQGALQILLHTTRSGDGSRDCVQTIRLVRAAM